METATARYDGHADWYDDWNAPHAEQHGPAIAELLGPGSGPCLDLGCGGGLYFDALASTGRTIVGADRSADQLRVARSRHELVVQADAAALPFADAVFPAVTTIWISTDVDDYGAVLLEAARVLAPGGTLLFYGVHPCFNGPHVEWLDDGGLTAHPTYRTSGWHEASPWWGQYVRRRVGMRHHPLAELLNGFLRAGLELDHVAEHGERAVPTILSIRARKPGAQPSSSVNEPRRGGPSGA